MPITPTDEDLDERRARRLGRRHRSTSSPTRCTTAWACSRASAPTRPPTARPCSGSPSTSSGSTTRRQIMMMDLPVLGRRAGRGDQARRARDAACRRATSARSPTTATARWGSTRCPCSVDVAIACWPWGAYLGDDAATKGVRMKISLVDPPRPQHHAAGVEDHRQLRELLPRQGRGAQGRLRRGHHAEPARARLASAPARTSSCARDGKLITPPLVGRRPRGHHPGHGDDHRRRPRLRVRRRRPHPLATSTSPRRCSSCGTAAEVSAVNSVDDRAIPCPGPMTTAIADEYAKTVRGQVDHYKDWVEHVA